MILVLRRGCTEEHVEEVLAALARRGLRGRVLAHLDKPAIHVFSGRTRRARRLLRMERVEALVPTSGPRVRREGRRFYPYHFLNWSSVAMLLVGILVLLAGYLPPGLGAAVDPFHRPDEVVLPWFMRGMQEFVRLLPDLPGWLGWLATAGAGATVLFLPLLERTRVRHGAYVFSLGMVAFWFALILWGTL